MKISLTFSERFFKRAFDLIVAFLGLMLTWWIILFAFILATIDTKKNGFFLQTRVGKKGHFFKIIKIRTMKEYREMTTTVTHKDDPRLTSLGKFFRKTKIDELPQLINVLLGHMSLVGPRPDVPGYADHLQGEDRMILNIRPGITGPTVLYFPNEEEILSKKQDPEKYNREILFPQKVKMNKQYIQHYSFLLDLKYIIQTFIMLYRGDNR